MKNQAFLKGLNAAKAHLVSFAKGFAVVGAAGVASAAAFGGLALRSFAATGDELDKMARRTGVLASSLAELRFAAEQSGTDIATVEKGLFGMSRALFDAERGGAKANESLKQIGLSFSDLKGLSPEKQFEKVGAAISTIADVSKRGAIAQALLGRAGRQLIPMFEDMESLRQESRRLGLIPTEQAVKSAADVTDAFNRIRRQIKSLIFEVGAGLAPAFLKLAEFVTPVLARVTGFVRSISTALLSGQWELAGKIAFKGLQIAMLEGVTALSDAIGGGMGDFLGSIGSKFVGGDFAGAWQDAVAGMLEVWAHFSTAVVDVFSEAASGVLALWQKVEDKITDFILKDASEGGWLGKLALLGTGVDMEEEKKRAERLNRQAAAVGAATDDQDFVERAQQDARAITASRVDKMTAAIEAMREAADQTAQNATRSREEQTAGGAERARGALANAQAELAALRGQLQQQEGQAGAVDMDMEEEVGKLRSQVQGTFSAAAAMAFGGGGTKSERLLDAIKKNGEKQIEQQKELAREVAAAGAIA